MFYKFIKPHKIHFNIKYILLHICNKQKHKYKNTKTQAQKHKYKNTNTKTKTKNKKPKKKKMNAKEYIEFKNTWLGAPDFCSRFVEGAIRHGHRNMDLCFEYGSENECSESHPSYYGEEFTEMVSNYNKLIDNIEELKQLACLEKRDNDTLVRTLKAEIVQEKLKTYQLSNMLKTKV